MNVDAIALRRISSRNQADGHSLEAQQMSTEREALALGVNLIRTWDEVQSSRRGKNFGRKDMEEMLRFCKQHKTVKYLLVDFMNRLMREVEVMIYYKVQLNQMGVQIYFCDSSQQHLNGLDQYSQLMLLIEGYKAEQDNVARYETTIARMKARYEAGYYLSHPHPGYIKSSTPGVHIADPKRFELLRRGCKLVIYKQHTAEQAVKWMNENGYKTNNGRKLDTYKFVKFMAARYYCGIIDISSEGWPKGVRGLHEAMLSSREHRLLVHALSKRNPNIRKKYNPDFPLSNIIRHFECMDRGGYEKFTGLNHNRGKRPSGKRRLPIKVYDCRDCRKRLRKEIVEQSFSDILSDLELIPSSKAFKKALLQVWINQRGSNHKRVSAMKSKRARLIEDLKSSTINFNSEPEGAVRSSLRLIIEDYDTEITQIDSEISNSQNKDYESDGFVSFAMQFVDNIRCNWWKLTPEDMKRGEQILFNGKIYTDNTARVHTPALSSIYRLGTNKKALSDLDNAHLEELAGTAPASVGSSC